MEYEEDYQISIPCKIKRPVISLRAIVTSKELLLRWPGRNELEIAKLIPKQLTPYRLLKTHHLPEGGNVFVCAKGVRTGSVYTGLLFDLVFDTEQVEAYEQAYPESRLPINTPEQAPLPDKTRLNGQSSVLEFVDMASSDSHLSPAELLTHDLRDRLGTSLAAQRQIAEMLKAHFPDLSDAQVGTLLPARPGTVISWKAKNSRGRRLLGKKK